MTALIVLIRERCPTANADIKRRRAYNQVRERYPLTPQNGLPILELRSMDDLLVRLPRRTWCLRRSNM
ncbi:hypothetical protein IscW_ISCW012591 [Ixodes scapularis]|uniref:Uncharacterized protein n=1 Tax=Ixodes scapularis TaxID=6945 RepID=B7QAA6_IXOSC|nr:hypothetical protein IscW_ISCW012591 [Ixodes scapularis]|eukprot:XP_002400209.1 hypothetical protein IscW_ISCW012591 [Ixodes scapularis]